MTLKSIQLATISPSNRAEGKFSVTAHSDDGDQLAEFDCDSEHDARVLRDAIREHASRLRHVADYRPRPAKKVAAPADLLAAAVAAERLLDSVAFVTREGDTDEPLRLLREAIAKATTGSQR